MKIYILTIEHRHGINTYPCITEEIARRELTNYVAEWWVGEEVPNDVDEMIDEYFENQEPEECYSIEDIDLIDK